MEHFDKYGTIYEKHFCSETGLEYQKRFLWKHLLKGIDFKNKKVLDAFCGTGELSKYLTSLGAVCFGNDISKYMMDRYLENCPGGTAYRGSFINLHLKNESFDIVVVHTGLHHLHPYLNEGVDKLWKCLKPNGLFIFVEPHSESSIEFLRKIWYKVDKRFEKNEAAISISDLENKNREKFIFLNKKFAGGLAYFLVFQSLTIGTPLWLKPFLAKILFPFEKFFRTKSLSFVAICQWKKKQFGKKISMNS